MPKPIATNQPAQECRHWLSSKTQKDLPGSDQLNQLYLNSWGKCCFFTAHQSPCKLSLFHLQCFCYRLGRLPQSMGLHRDTLSPLDDTLRIVHWLLPLLQHDRGILIYFGKIFQLGKQFMAVAYNLGVLGVSLHGFISAKHPQSPFPEWFSDSGLHRLTWRVARLERCLEIRLQWSPRGSYFDTYKS